MARVKLGIALPNETVMCPKPIGASAPHPTPCKTGASPRTLPARPCHTVQVQTLEARIDRLEQLVNNVARLHRKELMVRYGISEATFHRWVRAGRLPAPIRLGGPLWRLIDLEAYELCGRVPRPVSP